MSVRSRYVKKNERHGSSWEIDIRIILPDMQFYRRRLRGFGTRDEAERWGTEHHAWVLKHGIPSASVVQQIKKMSKSLEDIREILEV